ncbi:hypothetical protein ACLOJK_010087 [Asimina triloba]
MPLRRPRPRPRPRPRSTWILDRIKSPSAFTQKKQEEASLLLHDASRLPVVALAKSPFSIQTPASGGKPILFQKRQQGSSEKKLGTSNASRCKKGVVCGLFEMDPWAPTIDSQSIASPLFAASLFPYLGFLYFITKSKTAPKLTLFGFYFLLAFVGATTKVHYGTSLSNVDWLHGGAESLLTLTNLFIVMGLREALRKIKESKDSPSEFVPDMKKEKQSSV